jgi:dienelactone hydrolase
MLAGDTDPWRDVGHARWFDPLAALEDTKGDAFLTAARTLESDWSDYTRKNAKIIKGWQRQIVDLKEAALPLKPEYAHEVFTISDEDKSKTTEISVQYAIAHTMNVWIRDVLTHTGLTSFDAEKDSGLYFTVRDVGEGAEYLELAVYKTTQKTPLHRIKPVGPDAAFCSNGRLAYLTVENGLRYNSVVTVDTKTGKGKRCLYESKDNRCQLELLESHGVVFVRESNCIKKRIGYLTDASVRWLTPIQSTTVIPLSKTAWVENRHVVLNGRRIPLPHGEFLEHAKGLTETQALIGTVKNACSSLYLFDFPHHSFTPLFQGKTPGQIRIGSYTATAMVLSPNRPTELWDLYAPTERKDKKPTKTCTFPAPVALPVFLHGFVASADGTKIPYTVVSRSSRPRKLLVEAYGAYGISATRAYPEKWLAQLARGYAVAVVFARGGRENGDDWWMAATGTQAGPGPEGPRKQATFDDVYAAIPAIQRRLGISVGKTAFYGRSAGGWVAARVAQHSPPLCAVVLAEVPYVDVLRTTSNPRLPLTQMEYDEFGDPRRVADYAALVHTSPVDTVPLVFPGAAAILARTGFHDMEVSPYEAVKWVTKLRAFGWEAFAGIDEGGGHFAAKKQQGIQAAENAAFLDGVLSKTHGSTQGSPSRKGARTARRHSRREITFNSTRRRKH